MSGVGSTARIVLLQRKRNDVTLYCPQTRTRIFVSLMSGILWTVSGAAVQSEDSESAETVRAFLFTLRQHQLEAAAAEYPNEPNQFAAALYLPGSQLLAISATSAYASRLRELIQQGNYRQAYSDLSTSSDRKGHFFVQDLGADGLHRTREDDEPFDITWENEVTRTIYNGDWRSQAISETEYDRRFETDDRRYTRLLRVLITSLLTHSTQKAPTPD
jgi:hypothetical protein